MTNFLDPLVGYRVPEVLYRRLEALSEDYYLGSVPRISAGTIANFNSTDTPDGAVIFFSGRTIADDGGGGWFTYSSSSIATVDGGIVFAPIGGGRLLRDGYHELGFNGQVYVGWFGATGKGVTDDTSAIQAAIDYCTLNLAGCYFPSGVYKTDGTLSINGYWNLYGDGSTSVITTESTTLPLLTIDINVTTVYRASIKDLHFQGPVSTDPASCAIRFTGDNLSYISHCIFSNIWCTNFNSFVKDEKLPRTTAFGLEAMLNWNIWSDIHILSSSSYGWWMINGTGTGNGWHNIRCRTDDANSAVWRFGGVGCVVGDVLISGAHLLCNDAVTGSIGVLIDDSTVYRARFSIINTQFDANCNVPIKLGTTGSVEYNNFRFAGNNLGGAADLGCGLTYCSESVFEDREVDHRQAGKVISTSSTGALSSNCFDIDIASFGSVLVNVKSFGFIGGVAGVASDYQFHIRTDAVAMYINELESTITIGDQLVVSCTSISATKAQISITYTPTAGATKFTVLATTQGRKYNITRL